MKELLPKDEYGVFADNKDIARVDSRYVAEFFEKRHDHVVRDIENLDCSEEFRLPNFGETSYKDQWNRKQKAYAMTRDGFVFLAMGYRGKKTAKFKELYIKRFNEMEMFIKALVSARQEFPLLTENIKLLHDNPRPYYFSNECDMLNRLVTGMSTKQFRLLNNIDKGKSIRPYLTKEQVDMLDILQKVDVGLLVAFPNYEDRKRHLEWYKTKIKYEPFKTYLANNEKADKSKEDKL